MRNIPLCIGYHVGPLSRLSKSCIHFYLILLDFLYFDVVLIMGNPSPLGSQLQIGHNTLLLSVILHYCLNSADKIRVVCIFIKCFYVLRSMAPQSWCLCMLWITQSLVSGCSEFRLWHHTHRLQIVLAVLTGKFKFEHFPFKKYISILCAVISLWCS